MAQDPKLVEKAKQLKESAVPGTSASKMSVDEIAVLMQKAASHDKAAERAKRIGERLRAKNAIMVAKAKKAGIQVTDREVEEYLSRK